jgi:uroporphyrinogen decarboxylase
MTAAERVAATLAGQPVDRRAFVPLLGLYGARLTGCPPERYYNDPLAYAHGQLAVLETFAPDALCAPLCFSAIGAAFGGELVYHANQPPTLRRPVIRAAAEWDELDLPEVGDQPQLAFLRRAIASLCARLPVEFPVVVAVPSLPDLPGLVMGLEAWLEAVLFDPAGARAILDRLAPFYVRLVNGFIAAGAALVAMTCALASPAVMTRGLVAGFTRPVLAGVLTRMDVPVLLHCAGAPLGPHLDLLAGLPMVSGYIVDPGDDLGHCRAAVGAEMALAAGLDCTGLMRLPEAAIEHRCRALLAGRRGDARFILGTSGPDIVWETPPGRILAMRQALEGADG